MICSSNTLVCQELTRDRFLRNKGFHLLLFVTYRVRGMGVAEIMRKFGIKRLKLCKGKALGLGYGYLQ